MFEIVAGELHAKLRSSAAMCARAEAGLWGRGRAWPDNTLTTSPARLEAAARPAGPGRALRRHTEPHVSGQAPPVWRAPEGPQGLAAAAVGGGGAWPGFETTRRAELAARTASGRAAAHGHTKQPGPTSQARRRPEHQRRHKHHRGPGRPALTLRRRAQGVPCS